MKKPESPPDRQRAHIMKMLARAERRHRQAARLVEKWRTEVENLGRKDMDSRQPTLWDDGGATSNQG